ncbi:MAG TPA: GFA family protein [Actinomycetota bacterium]|nr:GFA family protein [Actinomycetota bacterium]
MTVRLASCSCGQLQAEVRGESIGVSVCHCYACQRRTGSVFGAQASFARESVAIKGNGTEFVRVGDQGGRFTFTFCPKCGSTVFYVEEGDEQEIAIPVGAFADSRFPAPTVSVYEKRRHSWVSLPDNVEHRRSN